LSPHFPWDQEQAPKKKKRLKKTRCAWLLTNRKDAWEKDQRYHRLSSESGIPKKALFKVKKEDRLKSSSNRGF
jgi:hypothetical protein